MCDGVGDAAGRCRESSGAAQGWCREDEDCLDGTCTRYSSRCGSGLAGDACDGADDCLGGLCLGHECQEGAHGALCETDAQCDTGRCTDGSCVDGRAGDACGSDAECSMTFCNLTLRRCGASCFDPSACDRGSICTASGVCAPPGPGVMGVPCRADGECASGSCYPYRPSTGEAFCAQVGGPGARCSTAAPCSEGFVCEGGRCVVRDGYICGHDDDDAGFQIRDCEGSGHCREISDFRTRCLDDTSRRCSSSAECGGEPCVLFFVCR